MKDNRRPYDDLPEEAYASEGLIRSFIKRNRGLLSILAGVLVVALVFFSINWYNGRNNPISRMVASCAKDLGGSFRFEVHTAKNGEDVMAYEGVFSADTGAHTVTVCYDASYPDYAYTAVIDTDEGVCTKGVYYQGKWMTEDVTQKLQDYYDFYADYRGGAFDSASFLRFTGLTSDYSPGPLDAFVKTLCSKIVSDKKFATVTTAKSEAGTTYTIDISPQAFFELIRDEGASIFFRSSDYDNFCMQYELGQDQIEDASCTLTFTVDSDGYLSELSFLNVIGGERYEVRCSMSEFGTAEAKIPDGFYAALPEKLIENEVSED